jgi:geranylgeranyl reductase family protein
MKSSSEFDVIVVGAGPAGACAAKFLADAGARVALVDGARFPRRKTCAGWVNIKAVREFPFLDGVRRAVKAAPLRRLVFHSSDLSETAQFASRATAGYIVRREKFDTALLRLAEKAGARAFLGRRVVAIETGEQAATVVLASGARIAGRILIGADGTQSTVARAAGLRGQWEPQQLIVCLSKVIPLTARQRAACFGPAEIHVSLGFGRAPGYAWAFPGAAHVAVGMGVRGGDDHRLRPLYDAWVKGLQAMGLLPKGAVGANPEGAVVPAGAALEFESHVGKRTLLIGDAGGFASAATGEGIYPGIQSAAVAAGCILRALDADRTPKKGVHCQDELQTFKTLWRQTMAPHLQMPNVNVAFLLPLIYTNQEIADRFGRAFLFGDNL